jgi:hypothetical protein
VCVFVTVTVTVAAATATVAAAVVFFAAVVARRGCVVVDGGDGRARCARAFLLLALYD